MPKRIISIGTLIPVFQFLLSGKSAAKLPSGVTTIPKQVIAGQIIHPCSFLMYPSSSPVDSASMFAHNSSDIGWIFFNE